MHNPKLALLASAFSFLVAHLAPGQAVEARHAMVVSAESLATAAGVDIMKRGGNAVDAAVAVGFMLAVTFPEAGNLGGGGFMVIRLADGRDAMIDFRERAPSAAHRDMYLDAQGNPIKSKSLFGALAAGVPGTPAGLLYALRRFGTMQREEVLRRAVEVADKGIRVDARLARSLRASMDTSDGANGFTAFPSSMRAFTKNGKEYREGDTLRQPDLAETMRALRDKGADGFYRGKVADLIVKEMRQDGGIVSTEDLESYSVVERRPVRGMYRGFEIISASPSSAGGIILLEILNILERYDLQSKGAHSAQATHLFAAAAQRAYADRSKFLGDPDFVNIPVDTLISKKYASARSASIDSLKATPSRLIEAGEPGEERGRNTTHFCAADPAGNIVSVTFTLNDLFGCKVVVAGAGFFLNDEMDDFVAKPGAPNMYGLVGGNANSISPDKRMLSSMTPTIVLREGKPFLVLGARGGGRIPTAVAQVILDVIDFRMPISEAVGAPRVHHQWLPDKIVYEPGALSTGALDSLRTMGYTLELLPDQPIGEVESILIDRSTGTLYGGPDPREGGIASGY